MPRLSWLHLSDLHMSLKGARWLGGDYRKDFERDLRRLHSQTGPWDLVLISGDLTATGSEQEFQALDAALESLWGYLGSLGSTPLLLAVPGNQDFQSYGRHLIEARQWYTNPTLREKFWNERDGVMRRAVHRAFQPFTSWLEQWQERHPSELQGQMKKGLLPGDFATTIVKDGLRVAIAGLNSAFLLPIADTSKTWFVIGEQQLEAAIGEISPWARSHDASLLLTHHSPMDLDAQSLKQLRVQLAAREEALLHLCGSQLSGILPVPNEKALARERFFQAPSLAGQDAGVGLPRKAGYAAGQIKVSSRGSRLRLFPRAMVSASPDREMFGPDKDLELDQEGALELRFTLSGRLLTLGSSDSHGALALKSTPALRFEPPPGIKLRATLDTRNGHEVGGLAWAPSGKAVAVGLLTGELLHWKPGANEPRWRVRAHNSPIRKVCFSPDGEELATSATYNVKLWEASGRRNHLLGTLDSEIVCLAWSSQGVLAVGLKNGVVHFWARKDWSLTFVVPPESASSVSSLAWSHDGQMLACGRNSRNGWELTLIDVHVENALTVEKSMSITSRAGALLDIAWHPRSRGIATALADSTIQIYHDMIPGRARTLAGHVDAVASVSFSADGSLLASRSTQDTIQLHRTDTWELVAAFREPALKASVGGIAFSPIGYRLASIGPSSQSVRIWDVSPEILLARPAPSRTVHSVSAKVVLVGEGRVGKSSLALRLKKDRYEELDSTHAMRTWTLPLDHLESQAQEPTNEKREIVLWDMGGQSEYRLVHQLFLHDTSVALMVMEPARGKAALDEIEGWDQRLSAQVGASHPVRRLLVGSKVDHEQVPVDRPAIDQFLAQRRFDPDAYLSTSAKTGRGIPELKAWLARAIDWSSLGRISQTELFERLGRHILRLRERGRVVITVRELEHELSASSPEEVDPEALRAVVEQLGRQGLIMDTRMADGTQALVLEIEQVERYANSLIVAARANPNRVPAVDVAAFSRAASLPRIQPQERLPRDQEVIVLDCVVEMLLQHGLCLSHGGLLVFPSLFLPTHSESGAGFQPSVSLSYEFSGPIDNIYASLITAIAMSRGFGPMRLWEARAEFGQASQDSVGLRKVQSGEQQARGFARLELYFDPETPKEKRELFVSFVDTHLRDQPSVEIVEQLSVTCPCGYVFPEGTVQRRRTKGQTDIICPECETRTLLVATASEARGHNPELVNKLRVLRTDMREQRTQSVTEARMSMQGAHTSIPQSTPIRILHLSDLHVGAGADPATLLQPLVADLRNPADLNVERLDYLVISGDITNRASPEEFQKALEFVSALRDEFSLTSERCIIVPGNHDLDWKVRAYEWQSQLDVDVAKLPSGTYSKQGEGYLVRDKDKYPERFRNFSQHFHHPLLQKEYPLDAEQQCIPILTPETRLQFLTLNSSWEVDQWFQDRSHIHDGALSRGLMAAEQQAAKAREAGLLSADARVLRLAVWHHPITGNEKMQRDAFMGRLQQAGVRLVLHGHVHEERADLIGYTNPSTQVHVIGAGSFGAPTYHRPESVPRLYNLLEVTRDHSQVRVCTRALRKEGGAWGGHPIWNEPNCRPYYDVKLR